jgi:hypothetical protein
MDSAAFCTASVTSLDVAYSNVSICTIQEGKSTYETYFKGMPNIVGELSARLPFPKPFKGVPGCVFGRAFIAADGSNGVMRGECWLYDEPESGVAGADRTVGYCLWYISGDETLTEDTRGFDVRSMTMGEVEEELEAEIREFDQVKQICAKRMWTEWNDNSDLVGVPLTSSSAVVYNRGITSCTSQTELTSASREHLLAWWRWETDQNNSVNKYFAKHPQPGLSPYRDRKIFGHAFGLCAKSGPTRNICLIFKFHSPDGRKNMIIQA